MESASAAGNRTSAKKSLVVLEPNGNEIFKANVFVDS
jgi:hypothetical protein